MPTPDEGQMGRALDDSAAIKEFYDLIDSYVPDLKKSLGPAERILFELVFDDDVGGFGSGIKDNMGQATSLKDKLMAGGPTEKAIYEKNAKRWSGFVGDTRKKLLEDIWDFIDDNMAPNDFQVLRDTFFADTTPESVEKLEKDKDQKKVDYQRGIDERKLAKFKWMEQNGKLSDKDKKSYQSLSQKLTSSGVDVSKIEPAAPKKGEKEEAPEEGGQTSQASVLSISARLASRVWS